MSDVSGCFCVYRNGDSYYGEYGSIQITGRQRDVDNAEYLIIFLSREIEKGVVKYKKELHKKGVRQQVSARVKAYLLGFIKRIYSRMYECQDQFFISEKKTQEAKGSEIMCIDIQSRVDDAKTFYTDVLGKTYYTSRSQAKYLNSSMRDGSKAAEQLEINNAVNQQESIKKLIHI